MKRKTEEKFELVRGSGNVFRDLSRPDADIKQLKGILAAEIIKLLDRESLTVRAPNGRCANGLVRSENDLVSASTGGTLGYGFGLRSGVRRTLVG